MVWLFNLRDPDADDETAELAFTLSKSYKRNNDSFANINASIVDGSNTKRGSK